MGQPRPLFWFIFVLFKHKFYRKYRRLQWDSNSDRQSRRRARWPLDHHHGPFDNFFYKVLIAAIRLSRPTSTSGSTWRVRCSSFSVRSSWGISRSTSCTCQSATWRASSSSPHSRRWIRKHLTDLDLSCFCSLLMSGPIHGSWSIVGSFSDILFQLLGNIVCIKTLCRLRTTWVLICQYLFYVARVRLGMSFVCTDCFQFC